MGNKAIILNHMFTGDYLLEQNIGHEVINLFKADDGQHYLYLCADGSYSGKIEEGQFQYVIQVRRPHHTVRTLEIISIAKVNEVINDSYAQESNITYGKVDLKKIFGANSSQQDRCVTFKVEEIIKPKEPTYIYYNQAPPQDKDEKNVYLTEVVKMEGNKEKYRFNVSRNLREYIHKGGEDYNTLNDFCERAFGDNTNWDSDFKEISIEGKKIEKDYPPTPADIYGIGTWELAYSNAFKYFLEQNNEFLIHFCNKCLQAFGESSVLRGCKDYKILREWEHIDLLIECTCDNDNKYVFVVENKIFSDLNGKDKSQLQVYRSVMEGKDGEKYKDHKKIYILLTPNHNKVECAEGWKRVLYSDVYDICVSIADKSYDFDTFKHMIEMHKESDFHYAVMKRRLERRLLEIK